MISHDGNRINDEDCFVNKILDEIHSPEDLTRLNGAQLSDLCLEIRNEIVQVTASNGGHLAPNLGVVELTVALYKVFHGPKDRIVWDVGHQTYAQKMLTGRYERFQTLRKFNGISGFQTPEESEHDVFFTGHAGVALSSVMGLAAAYEDTKTDGTVIAVVGDGALGNGVALEALNNVRAHRKNCILIINDNKMSISKSVGTISNHLNRIITGRVYNRIKTRLKRILKKFPFGNQMIWTIQRTEGLLKNLLVSSVFLEELGFKYVGPIDGHDLHLMIDSFEKIKEIPTRPIAVHVVTEKGHGCRYALEAPDVYHGISPFDPVSGKPLKSSGLTFSAAFGDSLIRLAEAHPDVLGITAAMATGTGMLPFSEKYPDRFYDVGIAEEHGLVFSAGLAAGGMRPVIALYSTFLQRGLDCVFHDICLPDLPVILCIDRAGIVEDGPTHHGIHDLGFLLEMPHLSILQPRDAEDLDAMMIAAYHQSHPVMIRYPRGSGENLDIPRAPIQWGRAFEVREGTDLAIWSTGRELVTALDVADLLRKDGLSVSVTDARFLKPFDESALLNDAAAKFLVTIEDCSKAEGFAGLVDRLLINAPHHEILHFGWGSGNIPFGSVAELRKQAGLTPDSIYREIKAVWEQNRKKNV